MNDDERLRARLRDADPGATLPPADPDRVSGLLEDAMSHETPTGPSETGARGRRALTWLVAAAAVVRVAGVTVLLIPDRGETPPAPPTTAREPTVLELTVPAGAGTGRCMVPNARALSDAEVAFDGEATEIAEGRVTLVPTRFYAGDPVDEVGVAQGTTSMRDLVGAVRFERGGRYLVAATGGSVMVCGFSGTYDAELADLYQEAFTP